MKLGTLAVAEALLIRIRNCQRTALFWAIVQRVVVIQDILAVPSSRVLFEFLTLADGTDRLSRNISKELPLLAM